MLFDDYKKLGHRFKKRRWVSHLRAFMLSRRLSTEPPAVRKKSCLIVRFDRIGDYVLFRDFLRAIRTSDRFIDYHITLVGNSAFQNIAETFDADDVDDFIWIDRSRFTKNKFYFLQTLKSIRDRGFETVLHPTYSRDMFADLIVLTSNAPHRIGVNGDCSNQSQKRRHITDSFYTDLIAACDEPQFEFNRNKDIIEKMVEQKTDITKPTWPDSFPNVFSEKEIAVFVIGAGSKRKRWDKFKQIAEFVFSRFGCKIVFVGKGRDDARTIHKLTQKANFDFIKLNDTLSLVQTGELMSKARLVFGNDSGLIHIAAVQGVPTVCVTPGAHAFRFNVYPDSFGLKTVFIFPPELEKLRGSAEFKNYTSHYALTFDVRSISMERVKAAIEELLSREA